MVPSGDQAGWSSSALLVRVRFLIAPCSAGTVKMSPRAEKAARAPFGDSA